MSSSWAPSLTHPRSGVAVSRETSVGRADTTSAGKGDRLPAYMGPERLRERRAHRPRGADPAEGDPARIRSETRGAWSLLGGPQRVKAPSIPISARTCLGLRRSPEPPGQRAGCLRSPFGPCTVPTQTVALPVSTELKRAVTSVVQGWAPLQLGRGAAQLRHYCSGGSSLGPACGFCNSDARSQQQQKPEQQTRSGCRTEPATEVHTTSRAGAGRRVSSIGLSVSRT